MNPLRVCLIAFAVICVAQCAERDDLIKAFNIAEIQPIDCHVQLVDQHQQPLRRVAVKVSIWSKTIDGGTQGQRDLPITTTDENGRIHVSGENGGYLGISVLDNNYITGLYPANAHQGWTFVLRYNHNSSQGSVRHGTLESPAVYGLWRREGPQPLISIKGDLRLPYVDQQPIRIDLVRGILVDEGGDLVVSVTMAKSEEDRKKQADSRGCFPYDSDITMVDGAVHAYGVSDDVSSFFPWTPGVTVSDFPLTMIPGQPSPNYAAAKSAAFTCYLQLRGGKYFGKATVAVGVEPYWRTDHGRVIIRVEALLNAAGSRSLEPDPARLTKLTLTDARKKPDADPKGR